jgi:hypothetical protein
MPSRTSTRTQPLRSHSGESPCWAIAGGLAASLEVLRCHVPPQHEWAQHETPPPRGPELQSERSGMVGTGSWVQRKTH